MNMTEVELSCPQDIFEPRRIQCGIKAAHKHFKIGNGETLKMTDNSQFGVIAEVTRNDGTKHEISIWQNSSDFPDTFPLIMGSAWTAGGNKFYDVERVPITEEIWRQIGKRLGFKFVIRKKVQPK